MENQLRMVTTKLPLADIMQEAWGNVHGTKKTFFLASIIYFAIYLSFSILLEASHEPWWLRLITYILSNLLSAGFIYLGLRRAFDLNLSVRMMFKAFRWHLGAKIIVSQFIITLLIAAIILFCLVVMLLLIPFFSESAHTLITSLFITIGVLLGVFFVIRFSLTSLVLMAQKEVGPLKAIAISYRSTRGNFWRLTLLMVFSLFLVILSVLTLGVGFIWSIPFVAIAWAFVYKQLVAEVFTNV